LHLPAPVRRRPWRDARRTGPGRSAGRHDRRPRVRAPPERLARALGAPRPRRPARRRARRRGRLARGGVIPGAVDPRLLVGLAARPPARRLARSRHRRRLDPRPLRGRRDHHVGTEEVRPAFYALRGGGWRDYVTLVHLPYTAWNLAYVAI